MALSCTTTSPSMRCTPLFTGHTAQSPLSLSRHSISGAHTPTASALCAPPKAARMKNCSQSSPSHSEKMASSSSGS